MPWLFFSEMMLRLVEVLEVKHIHITIVPKLSLYEALLLPLGILIRSPNAHATGFIWVIMYRTYTSAGTYRFIESNLAISRRTVCDGEDIPPF